MSDSDADLVPIQRELNVDEFKIAHSGPAVLSNRFFISLGPWGVRIAFAEQHGESAEPIFRSAVVMPMEDGISLYKTLQELLKEPEDMIRKASEIQQKIQSV
ncbi:hypothetical protein C8R26_103133 [Nitrosomonas oligotropha]|uniref:Uncharacterized protein n=1 Tax=Nitrosomonas oligotropha TaxID=42354 RepID=A0A2T5I3G1_9PROT|nr:hypothetical protein [Nitrosomonas oligotropha]PTQ78371.1 hypothetical protein C8R26_103133 [Nitrosomonas oligotropha]